jgi:hypothetical protein
MVPLESKAGRACMVWGVFVGKDKAKGMMLRYQRKMNDCEPNYANR